MMNPLVRQVAISDRRFEPVVGKFIYNWAETHVSVEVAAESAHPGRMRYRPTVPCHS